MQAGSQAVPVRRIHSLDGLRSGLMLLGVVLHAAYPYGHGARWLVRDPQRNAFFEHLGDAIHLFRMPAFFLIAGYFSSLLLRQQAPGIFLRERFRRIGVPLLATLCTLNLVQAWLLDTRGQPGAWLPSGDEVQLMWSSGSLVGHLWFLTYLLVFCSALALLSRPLRRLGESAWPARMAQAPGFAALLSLAVAGTLGVVALDHLAPQQLNHEYLGLIDPSELLSYVPYFGVGAILELDESLLLRFSSPGPGTSLVGIASLALGMAMEGEPSFLARGLHVLAATVLTWTIIRLLFGTFRRIAGGASPFFRYLSDASYSIYLMHHLVVVALASWLLQVHWGAWPKFITTLSLTLAITLAVHHFLILRWPLLRFLFNGKPLRRE